MKFKSFYVAALAASVLVSCNKDEVSDYPGGSNEAGEETVMKIGLTQESVTTRAFPSGEDVATAPEKEIKTARILVFDTDGKLEHDMDLTVTAGVPEEPVFKTTAGKKTIYALVNLPAKSTLGSKLEAGSSIGQVQKLIANIEAMTDLSSSTTGYFMTNFDKNHVVTTIEKGITEKEVREDGKNEITVPVGRAFAKVNLRLGDNVEYLQGKLEDISYRVRNNPNAMFTVQKYDASYGYLLTPYFDLTLSTVAEKADYYFDNGAPVAPATVPTFTAIQAPTYAMENSHGTPKYHQSTYLSLKGTFTPDKVFDSYGEEVATAPVKGADFYRIRSIADDEYTSKIYNAGTIQASELERALEGFNADPTDNTTYEIIKYEDGICYYGIWIEDQDYYEKGDLVNTYTVRRNYYYYAVINQVKGPGSNDEDGVLPVDPEEPIKESTWIKAIIEVQPWVGKNINSVI